MYEIGTRFKYKEDAFILPELKGREGIITGCERDGGYTIKIDGVNTEWGYFYLLDKSVEWTRPPKSKARGARRRRNES